VDPAGAAWSSPGAFAKELADPVAAIGRPGFLAKLPLEDPCLAALTRSACSITRVEGAAQ
jgi:hypothetical protein